MSLAASLVSLVEAESAFQAREKKKKNHSWSWIGSSSDSKFSSQPESFRLADDGILGDTSLLIGFFFFLNCENTELGDIGFFSG